MSWVVSTLKLDFAIKDLGELSYFLGIQATQDNADLHLHQSKYILDLLDRTQMTESKLYLAHCVAGTKCPNLMASLYLIPPSTATLLEHFSTCHSLDQKLLIRSTNCVNTCMPPQLLISQQPNGSYDTSRVPLIMDFNTTKVPLPLLSIVTRIGQGILMTGDLPPVLVSFLAPTSFLGQPRSNTLSPYQA
jgi:hypothetical protein